MYIAATETRYIAEITFDSGVSVLTLYTPTELRYEAETTFDSRVTALVTYTRSIL